MRNVRLSATAVVVGVLTPSFAHIAGVILVPLAAPDGGFAPTSFIGASLSRIRERHLVDFPGPVARRKGKEAFDPKRGPLRFVSMDPSAIEARRFLDASDNPVAISLDVDEPNVGPKPSVDLAQLGQPRGPSAQDFSLSDTPRSQAGPQSFRSGQPGQRFIPATLEQLPVAMTEECSGTLQELIALCTRNRSELPFRYTTPKKRQPRCENEDKRPRVRR